MAEILQGHLVQLSLSIPVCEISAGDKELCFFQDYLD